MMRAAVLCSALGLAAASTPGGTPPAGPYSVESRVDTVPALDRTNQQMRIFWPGNATAGQKFPMISYIHGMASGSLVENWLKVLDRLFEDIASWGFVIVAPSSCGQLTGLACHDKVNAPYTDCGGLSPVKPNGWASFYGEQLKGIEYAQNQTKAGDVFADLIDWSTGVGVAGHSMGGQATTLASCAACAKKWDIRSACLHHSANGDTTVGNIGVNVSVPLAAFTSSGDGIWHETHDIYTSASVIPKVYRDQVGFSHLEPITVLGSYNPWIATMTAAWFKVTLNGDTGKFHSMIFDNSTHPSLCNYAPMAACETHDK